MKTGFGIDLPIEETSPGRARIQRSDREHCRSGKSAAAVEDKPSAESPYRSKLEARYAGYLDLLKQAGEIIGYQYEPIRFLLPGKRNTYKADFLVQRLDRSIEIHEVKGYHKNLRDSVTKCKTAAGLNWWGKFIKVTWEDGRWIQTEVSA